MSFCVYCLRNNNGEYVSMSGDLTKEWLKASKFLESDIERRLKYVDEKFKLVKFEVTEINYTDKIKWDRNFNERVWLNE